MMENNAIIVVDLGFGDSGKGTMVDALVRRREAGLVCRFNGGAQAAHTVVAPDKTHTFHQFGAGTLAGADTFLSRHVPFNPVHLFWEDERLAEIGVTDAMGRLFVDANAKVTTPYHVIANRLREIARGAHRHGSCGLGIGETVQDSIDGRFTMCVSDLPPPGRGVVAEKLREHRAIKIEQLRREGVLTKACDSEASDLAARYVEQLFDDDELSATIEVFEHVGDRIHIVGDGADFLSRRLEGETVVFEGAQGILLDEDFGVQPYTTWSKTGPDNAIELLYDTRYGGKIEVMGVCRAYMTRHGAGPFPTEDTNLTRLLPEEHNPTNAWQENFRVGWLDLSLLRYAIRCARKVDSLAVTCLDRIPQTGDWKVAPDDGHLQDAPRDPVEYARFVANSLGLPLSAMSFGPSYEDKRWSEM